MSYSYNIKACVIHLAEYFELARRTIFVHDAVVKRISRFSSEDSHLVPITTKVHLHHLFHYLRNVTEIG